MLPDRAPRVLRNLQLPVPAANAGPTGGTAKKFWTFEENEGLIDAFRFVSHTGGYAAEAYALKLPALAARSRDQVEKHWKAMVNKDGPGHGITADQLREIREIEAIRLAAGPRPAGRKRAYTRENKAPGISIIDMIVFVMDAAPPRVWSDRALLAAMRGAGEIWSPSWVADPTNKALARIYRAFGHDPHDSARAGRAPKLATYGTDQRGRATWGGRPAA
jgi:hypothetical protein